MADETENPLQAYLRAIYGHGYEPANSSGDPNSLGYALHGPAPPVDTSNVLGTMASQQAARESAPYKALTNLLTTWLAPAAAAHRAISGSNLPKAIAYHNRLEQKQGNQLVNPWTTPFLSSILAMLAPGMARGLRGEDLKFSDRPASLLGRTLDKSENATTLLQPHVEDTAHILNHLNDLASRAPKYSNLYATAASPPSPTPSSQEGSPALDLLRDHYGDGTQF